MHATPDFGCAINDGGRMNRQDKYPDLALSFCDRQFIVFNVRLNQENVTKSKIWSFLQAILEYQINNDSNKRPMFLGILTGSRMLSHLERGYGRCA